jgi:hypothetical protein
MQKIHKNSLQEAPRTEAYNPSTLILLHQLSPQHQHPAM